MDGVSPLYRDFVNSFLSTFLKALPRYIVDAIPNLTDQDKIDILPNISDWAWNFFNLFKTGEEKIVNSSSNPVIMAVNALPKEELAVMAETLVNLTSFRKKMSMLSETVGGPIDVAIISKGDGFLWIKHKHYFKAELNPHFFKK
jgi:S-adenosylmethionine synthetase